MTNALESTNRTTRNDDNMFSQIDPASSKVENIIRATCQRTSSGTSRNEFKTSINRPTAALSKNTVVSPSVLDRL